MTVQARSRSGKYRLVRGSHNFHIRIFKYGGTEAIRFSSVFDFVVRVALWNVIGNILKE
jgi:hypothetical protein